VLASINVVNRHWARLLLGWVTACGQVNRLGMQQASNEFFLADIVLLYAVRSAITATAELLVHIFTNPS